jgi:hypothetical protein
MTSTLCSSAGRILNLDSIAMFANISCLYLTLTKLVLGKVAVPSLKSQGRFTGLF